jgi:hypothetical protein
VVREADTLEADLARAVEDRRTDDRLLTAGESTDASLATRYIDRARTTATGTTWSALRAQRIKQFGYTIGGQRLVFRLRFILALARVRRWPSAIRSYITGADADAARNWLHSAGKTLLMLESSEAVRGQLPDLRASLLIAITPDDPRRDAFLRELDLAEPDVDLHRARIAEIKSVVDAASDSAIVLLRGYRNMLAAVAAIVTIILVAVALIHEASPRFLSLCESTIVCGSAASVGEVEAAGALGGLLVGVLALGRLIILSVPVSLAAWLSLIRVPIGAAAGLIGALLVQGRVVNLLAAQPKATVLAYAVLFGAASELVVRGLDRPALRLRAASGEPARLTDRLPRRAAERADLSRRLETLVSERVAETVHEVIAGPVLANFTGTFNVTLLEAEGAPVAIDEGGNVNFRLGRSYRIVATLSREPAPHSRSVPVAIVDGVQKEEIDWDVTLTTEHETLADTSRALRTGPDSPAATTFELQLTDAVSDLVVWFRLSQEGRLVQLLDLRVSTMED